MILYIGDKIRYTDDDIDAEGIMNNYRINQDGSSYSMTITKIHRNSSGREWKVGDMTFCMYFADYIKKINENEEKIL